MEALHTQIAEFSDKKSTRVIKMIIELQGKKRINK